MVVTAVGMLKCCTTGIWHGLSTQCRVRQQCLGFPDLSAHHEDAEQVVPLLIAVDCFGPARREGDLEAETLYQSSKQPPVQLSTGTSPLR